MGCVLRERREERGISLGALAARSGVDKSTLSRWERGATVPRPQALAVVLQVLGLPSAPLDLVRPAKVGDPSPEHLRALRYAYDLSQHEFADRLGVTQATVSRWEAGKGTMPPATVRNACLRLGMPAETLSELFASDGDPLPPGGDAESVDRMESLVSSMFFDGPITMTRSQGLVTFLRLQSRLPALAAADSVYVPVLARFLARQALQRSEQGRWSEAEACVERALRLGLKEAFRAGQALPFIVRGRARRREGELGTAMDVLEEALRGPVPPEVRSWMVGELSELQALAGEFGRGARLAHEAVARECDEGSVWFRRKSLARVLVSGRRYAEALRVFPPTRTDHSYPAQLDEAEIWAQAFLGLDEADEAAPWIAHFDELVAKPGLWGNRPRANRLRRAYERTVRGASVR